VIVIGLLDGIRSPKLLSGFLVRLKTLEYYTKSWNDSSLKDKVTIVLEYINKDYTQIPNTVPMRFKDRSIGPEES